MTNTSEKYERTQQGNLLTSPLLPPKSYLHIPHTSLLQGSPQSGVHTLHRDKLSQLSQCDGMYREQRTPVLAADDYNVQSVEVRSCGEFRAGFDLHSPSLTPASRAFPLNFQSQERDEKKEKGTRQGILHKSR